MQRGDSGLQFDDLLLHQFRRARIIVEKNECFALEHGTLLEVFAVISFKPKSKTLATDALHIEIAHAD